MKETPRRRITIKSSSNEISTTAGKRVRMRGGAVFRPPSTLFDNRDFFLVFHVRYSTLLHLPPLRFHCVGGWRSKTRLLQLRHWQSDALTTRLVLSHNSARSHPLSARSHPQSSRSHSRWAISHPHLARSHPLSDRYHPHSARSHPHSA
jgi:hypothetical protein